MTHLRWKADPLLAGSWRGATSALLSDGRWHIVVDTGMPHEGPLIIQALSQLGIAPEDVRIIVNTHFHVDHVLNNSLFPGALIYASQESYDWCRALYSDLADERNWEKLALKYYPEMLDYERARTHMHKLRKLALRWWDVARLGDPSRFCWVEREALPDGLKAAITSGHVPGHVSIVARDGCSSTLIAGDAVLSRDKEAQVLTMIPHRREQFERERAQLLAVGGRILPGHGAEFSIPGNDPPSSFPSLLSS